MAVSTAANNNRGARPAERALCDRKTDRERRLSWRSAARDLATPGAIDRQHPSLDLPLTIPLTRLDVDWLHGGVGRLQPDAILLTVEALEGRRAHLSGAGHVRRDDDV